MRHETIDRYLWDLAARVPAPGGGATAGLHLAQAAALLGRAARDSDGGPEDRRDTVRSVRNRADELRRVGINLADADARAFTAVSAAHGLSRDTDTDRDARASAIQEALEEAGRVAAGMVRAAGRVVELAATLRPVGNRSVIADVGAAADAARSAASTARLNVETTLGLIEDPLVRLELDDALDGVDDLLRRADEVTAGVRERIRR